MQIHDHTARFRANAAFLAEAKLRAERRHMTFSELMRHALRRELEEAA